MDTSNYLKIETHKNFKFPLTIYHCHVDNNTLLPPHYHDNFEILYVKSGKLNIQIGNNVYVANEKSLLFANMYQVHSASSINGLPAYYSAIVFDKKILETININEYYIDFIKPFIEGSQRFPEHIEKGTLAYKSVRSSIELIIEEYHHEKCAYEIFIITAIERLFATFMRYPDKLQMTANQKLTPIHKELFDALLCYIADNFSKEIDLEVLSSHLNLNKFYLCRVIKKITGKSFTQFLNIYRIRYAETLLKSTSLPISRIAESAGFSNLSYFNRVFLRYTGTTPSKLRG